MPRGAGEARPLMEILLGRGATSPFRLEKALARVRGVLPAARALTIEPLYFLALARAPDPGQRARLEALLGGATPLDPASLDGAGTLIIAPRPGTVSPWSSKATDILHNCALDAVERIEHGRLVRIEGARDGDRATRERAAALLHDRMTEAVLAGLEDAAGLFAHPQPGALARIPVTETGRTALEAANATLGLALSAGEIDYLLEHFAGLGRDPTDVELMMFAQINSEHCRHKIFNAAWTVDGVAQAHSLFDMIRNTHRRSPGRVLSAYRDNAAVAAGYEATRWLVGGDGRYRYAEEAAHLVAKVETHNHPTAIAPHPGAGTGAGGEIRDEAATGRGARSKAGFTGFSVSNLLIPGFEQPWERTPGHPRRIAPALQIMLEGPIGAAAFNNEFGRPALAGYFRTLEVLDAAGTVRGYHKPIMLAGGMGSIRPDHVTKCALPEGASIVVLGGPAMLIGLGGGAASSMASGRSEEALDFASVQRANPEMQRRCQEVIDHCAGLGARNPVLSIHDVGAGGLSNAVPELLETAGRGGTIEIRDVPSAEPGMSPLEIWCNEAQERYVLAIESGCLGEFEATCRRERCPFAVIGRVEAERRLRVTDRLQGEAPVDLPMEVLLGRPPGLSLAARRAAGHRRGGDGAPAGLDPAEAVRRVLRLPAVADKTFLVTIGDRSVGGLVARDQMVGPWQVPVADCAVTASGFREYTGEALAVGERTPLALLDAAASARMAVGEALTNLAAARVMRIEDVMLSANWMAASGEPAEDAALFEAVEAVGLELCPALGVPVPVGKDSLSMRTLWHEDGEARGVTAPLSLIVSAFAPVIDVRATLTPALRRDCGESVLLLIDLGRGRNRLGGSALAQVHERAGGEPPDLDAPEDLRAFFAAVQILNEAGLLLAYHDRADGGLLATLCELAFAGRTGLAVELDSLDGAPLEVLFNEELGAVVQVRAEDVEAVIAELARHPALAPHVHRIGAPEDSDRMVIANGGEILVDAPLGELHRAWSETGYRMQALRDEPDCAREAFDALLDRADPGLSLRASFDAAAAFAVPATNRPRVAVLREQGVNGHAEMAAAFERAGFEPVDVHMSDIVSGRGTLEGFQGLAACGGFSYGDVLGAGGGWAGAIRYNPRAREAFEAFFQRPDTFTLGVCNGCQMLAHLKDLIPGAAPWPAFVRNRSEQFEARLAMVEVLDSPSLLFAGMAGSRLPIVVAHGEGRVAFEEGGDAAAAEGLATLRYVDNHGRVAETYPANPNGSPDGLTGFTTPDGRVTILMPHPERVFRACQFSWLAPEWTRAEGPWLALFANARRWVG